MSSLRAVIEAVANVTRTVSGIVYSPAFPPDNVSEYDVPAALILASSGAMQVDTHGNGDGTYPVNKSVTLMIRLALKYDETQLDIVAPQAVDLHEPLADALMSAWLRNRFNETAPFMGRLETGTNVSPLRWEFVSFQWGGQNVIGFDYELDLTYREDIAA